jgi:hypothetical protein
MVDRPEQYTRSSAAAWAGEGSADCPIVTRRDFPFGSTADGFPDKLLEFQSRRMIDHVYRDWRAAEPHPQSVAARDRLAARLAALGIAIPA